MRPAQHFVPAEADRGRPGLETGGDYPLPGRAPHPPNHSGDAAPSPRAGAAAVGFGGEKVRGGRQAGIIAGQRPYVEQVRQNPLM
ncbi:MAG: hypothetical protein OXE49_06025, partial [Gemmatimonadetes bacterium]|nr:hypothetical protein [Gemmatimonadota bacterium]